MDIAYRLKRLRNELGKSQTDIARELDIKPQSYSKYEKGTNKPSLEILSKLQSKFGVSTDWLICGLGSMYGGAKSSKNYLVPIPAQAGYLDGTFQDSNSVLEYISIPGYTSSNHRSFEVGGDSMNPSLFNGDIVICERVENLKGIAIGEVHVICTKRDGIIIKRFELAPDRKHMRLVPDNNQYKVVTVPLEDLAEAWRVRLKITGSMGGQVADNTFRLAELEKQMRELLGKKNN